MSGVWIVKTFLGAINLVMKMKRLINFKILVIFLILFAACAEVPLTHRKSLKLLPQPQLLSMSLQHYDQVLKKEKLSKDPELVGMVKRVGKRIAGAAEAFLKELDRGREVSNYQWEFALIKDDKVANAWCMPGGKVAVYTGIFPYTRDENGLAVVIGHEVAHALANHGNERMSHELLATMGGVALSVALAERPRATQDLFLAAFGVGASLGFLLPYSRVQESEADRIGVMLMAKAGYDPRGALPFWERMREAGGQSPPEFLSTHPSPDSRIANLKGYITETMPYYKPRSQSSGL